MMFHYDFIPGERCALDRTPGGYDIWHHGLTRFISSGVVGGGKQQCLRICCDSDSSLECLTMIQVSPSSRVLREEVVRGVESDLVDSFEEGEIRDDSVFV
ncbi:hypothetical protein Tco_0947578 [Tanacetum coccineum]